MNLRSGGRSGGDADRGAISRGDSGRSFDARTFDNRRSDGQANRNFDSDRRGSGGDRDGRNWSQSNSRDFARSDGGRNWDGKHDWHGDHNWYHRRYYGSGSSFFFGFGSPFWPWYAYRYPAFYWNRWGVGWGYPYYYAYQPVYVVDSGIDPYTTAYAPDAAVAPQAPLDAAPQAAEADPAAGQQVDEQQEAVEFAADAEAAFRAGEYDQAARLWRHSLVDNPRNAPLLLLLGQALFATGKFEESAGAVQRALSVLPQDQWGAVVTNYKQLYNGNGDYTRQLRALEKAREEQPNSPALRFLLGYHYGFLGYPQDAREELDKAIELAPKDQIVKKLRDLLVAQASGEKVQAPQSSLHVTDEPAAQKPALPTPPQTETQRPREF